MNAKFPTPNWSSVGTGYFRMEPSTVGGSYGSLKACVRYFGPTAEVLNQGTVRVEAFTSPDFSGDPAARAFVATADKASVAAYGSDHVAQVTLAGLPVGKYYVRAYIDHNTYGTKNALDDWESWGYSCDRSGNTASMFAPVAWTIDKSTAGETCVIYVEDADTNGNRIPDAYEMYVNGGTLDNGAQNLDETLDCGLAVKKCLLGTNVTELTTSSADFSGLVAHYASALQTRALAAMALGVPAASITVDAATGALVVNPTVDGDTVAITDFAFDAAAGKVVLKVTADVDAATAASSTIYAVTAGSTVTVKVLHTDTLAGDWTTVATRTVKVSGASLDTGLIEIDVPDVTVTSGFYKVEVE